MVSMKYTKSAGGVILNKERKIAVVSQSGLTWSLPKGHIDDGEDELGAAIREIYEETGITSLKLIKNLGSYQRTSLLGVGGETISEIKTIFMFLFETKEELLRPVDPHNPEAIWVEKEKVVEILSHPRDKEFFLNIIKEIK